jgi:hypothetical protein
MHLSAVSLIDPVEQIPKIDVALVDKYLIPLFFILKSLIEYRGVHAVIIKLYEEGEEEEGDFFQSLWMYVLSNGNIRIPPEHIYTTNTQMET